MQQGTMTNELCLRLANRCVCAVDGMDVVSEEWCGVVLWCVERKEHHPVLE